MTMPGQWALLLIALTVSLAAARAQRRNDFSGCMYNGAACPYQASNGVVRWPEFVSAVWSCVQRTYVRLSRAGVYPYVIDDGNSSNMLESIDNVGYFEPFVTMALRSFYSIWIAQDRPSEHWAKTKHVFDVYCRYTTPAMAQCLKRSPSLPRSGKGSQAVQQMVNAWINRYCVQPSNQPGGRRSFDPLLRRRLAEGFTNMTAPLQCLMLTPPGTAMDKIEMSPNATTFLLRFYFECLDPEVLALLLTASSPSDTDMAPGMNYMSTRMVSLLYATGRCGMRVLNDFCPVVLSGSNWNQLKFYLKTIVGKITGRQLTDDDLNWDTSSVPSSNRTIKMMFGQRHVMTLADPFVETCQPMPSLPLTYAQNRYFSVSDYGAFNSSRLVTLSFFNDTLDVNSTVVAQYFVGPDTGLRPLQYQGLITLDGNLRTVVQIGNAQVTFTTIPGGFVKITDYRSGTVFLFRVDGPSITLTMSSPVDILRNSYGTFVRGCMFSVKTTAKAPSAACYQACTATISDMSLIKRCAWDCTNAGPNWVPGYGYLESTKTLADITDVDVTSLQN